VGEKRLSKEKIYKCTVNAGNEELRLVTHSPLISALVVIPALIPVFLIIFFLEYREVPEEPYLASRIYCS
jgi:hypothetical protein